MSQTPVVTLVYVSPELSFELSFPWVLGLSVVDLLQQANLTGHWPEVNWSSLAIGVWHKVVPLETYLKAGDRVELYRPLQIDPKDARRLRQTKRGR